jgi:tRNA 2-thiocytidine biosynthesis protein TtcA
MSEQEQKRKKLFLKLSRKVGKTLQEYKMIEADDRVLLGLSGGKDSMALLETLVDRRKHLPFNFELYAVHVTAKGVGYEMNTTYLQEFCDDLKVPLHLEDIEVDLTVDSKKAPCFVCSWHRRKRLFEMTRELNCNRLALGHHKDDAIQTVLMNMIYHGSFSSIPQDLTMFEGRIRLIRPLLFIPEIELIEYANYRNFQKLEKSCLYQGTTKRQEMKDLIIHLEKFYPNARRNIFTAMGNIHEEYLPRK